MRARRKPGAPLAQATRFSPWLTDGKQNAPLLVSEPTKRSGLYGRTSLKKTPPLAALIGAKY